MTKFLWKDVICRDDCFKKLIVNDEFENKKFSMNLCSDIELKKWLH
jgi:hypothetical protein